MIASVTYRGSGQLLPSLDVDMVCDGDFLMRECYRHEVMIRRII